MTNQERGFIKHTANIIFNCLHEKMYDQVMEGLESDNFTSMEEIDAFVGAKLAEYESQCKAIRSYYDTKLGYDEDSGEDVCDMCGGYLDEDP